MLIQMDRRIQDVLDSTLALLREDASPLEEVFKQESERDRATIRQYFQQTKIPVRLGFPRAVTELPGLYVILGGLQESDFPIGRNAGDEVTSLRIYEHLTSRFDKTVRVACWATNADVVVWLSNVVIWALLGSRESLQRLGMQQQALSAQDLDTDPRFYPDFLYRRDIRLTAKCQMDIAVEFFKLRDVIVTPTVAEDSQPVTITMR